MKKRLRVAVGANDELRFNTSHFGDSKYFMIYDVYDDGEIKLVEVRRNNASDMEEEMHGDPKKFKVVISQLTDTDVLLAYAMGPNFKRIIESSNKIPYIIRGVARKSRGISDGLKEVIRRFNELYEKAIYRKHKDIPI